MAENDSNVLALTQKTTKNSTELKILRDDHEKLATKFEALSKEVREQQRTDDSLAEQYAQLQSAIAAVQETAREMKEMMLESSRACSCNLNRQIHRLWIANGVLFVLVAVCILGVLGGDVLGVIVRKILGI